MRCLDGGCGANTSCQLSKSCNEQEGSEVVGVDGSAAVSLAFGNEVIRFSRFNTADPGL